MTINPFATTNHTEGISTRSGWIGPFRVSQESYSPSTILHPHAHAKAAFICVFTGSCTERYGRTKLSVGPRSVIFRPAHEPHSDHFASTESSGFLIEMPQIWLQNLKSRGARLNEPRSFPSSRATSLMLRIYDECRRPDDLSDLAIDALLVELAVETSRLPRGSRVDKPKLRRVQEVLLDRPTSPPRLSELAAIAELHPTHLARAFRKQFQCTIGDFIRRRRVEMAWERLTSTNSRVVDIALECGFSNQAHFATVFKRLTGLTPVQARQRIEER